MTKVKMFIIKGYRLGVHSKKKEVTPPNQVSSGLHLPLWSRGHDLNLGLSVAEDNFSGFSPYNFPGHAISRARQSCIIFRPLVY